MIERRGFGLRDGDEVNYYLNTTRSEGKTRKGEKKEMSHLLAGHSHWLAALDHDVVKVNVELGFPARLDGLAAGLLGVLQELVEEAHALRGVEVHEAEVNLVARDATPVVQHQQDLVPHQLPIHARQALLQAARQSQLDPHAQEDGRRVQEEPAHAEGEQGHALQTGEEQRQQDGKGEQYPADQDALVADVVHREAVVVHQRLHRVHVVLHGELAGLR